ncbi:MAG: head-tail connector protein [Prevotellaceae bacterium]|nr:head-tail connector protein [Prevotellaceae bacterium]
MKVLKLSEIKMNSRIEEDMEDAVLVQMGEAAEAVIEASLNRTWEDIEKTYGGIPADIKRACLMLTDHYYNNRGATSNTSVTALPFGIQALVKHYVKLI